MVSRHGKITQPRDTIVNTTVHSQKDMIRSASQMITTLAVDPTLPEFLAQLEEKQQKVIEARRSASRMHSRYSQVEVRRKVDELLD